ncbi:hypothetical protein BH11BAC6_BH11BAC6_12610 [soil metagenome]
MKRVKVLIPSIACCILIIACKSPEQRAAEAEGNEYSDSVRNSPPPAGPNTSPYTGNARYDSSTQNEMVDSSKH